MEIIFDKSFSKSLNKLSEKDIKNKIVDIIVEVELAKSLTEITNVKKMQGFKPFIALGLVTIALEWNLKIRRL